MNDDVQLVREIGEVKAELSGLKAEVAGTNQRLDDIVITQLKDHGKRLAMQEKTPESITGGDGDAIIPLKAAQETRRLLDGDDLMTIRIGDKQCSFVGNDFELTTKLIGPM